MFLGFDIGTSGVKAVLLDADGAVRGQATADHPVSNPQPLWSEQDPASWWESCRTATAALKAEGAPLDAVRAMGLSGQMHGATLLDASGAVLRPCILWNDGRSHAECAELEASAPDFRKRSPATSPCPASPLPSCSGCGNMSQSFSPRVARCCCPRTISQYRLTGGFASEMSDAAGTLWLDPARRDWDETLLAATGLNRSHMPRCRGLPDRGRTDRNGGDGAGLPPGAGRGWRRRRQRGRRCRGGRRCDPAQGFLSLGTSGVLFVAERRAPRRPETHGARLLPLSAEPLAPDVGESVGGQLAGLAGAHRGRRDVAELLARLEASGKTETTVALPALSVRRAHPAQRSPRRSGQFHRPDQRHRPRRSRLWRCWKGWPTRSRRRPGRAARRRHEPSGLALIGGGARSPRWRQLLADALDLPLVYRAGGEVGPALGAARLAMIGAATGDVEAAIRRICTQPPRQDDHSPRPAHADYHQTQLERYRTLYALTRTLHERGPAP